MHSLTRNRQRTCFVWFTLCHRPTPLSSQQKVARFYDFSVSRVKSRNCSCDSIGLHLVKTYCLPTLTYGLENSVLTEKTTDKISVLWNNCFRHIFRCCWRESVRPLQYYCRTLPMLHLVNQTKLLFWKKMYTNSNVVLYTLSRYACVPSRFMAVASQYGIHSMRQTAASVKLAVWKSFTDCSYLEFAYFILLAIMYLCVVFYVCIFICYLMV